jgi:hypothetical protein
MIRILSAVDPHWGRFVARACGGASLLLAAFAVIDDPDHRPTSFSFFLALAGVAGAMFYLHSTNPMRLPPADRRAWAEPTTLSGLGEVTARYLTGEITTHPYHRGPLDPETDPQLAATLAAFNRAGYVTVASQPQTDAPGYDGAGWRQRAAVEGFADEATAWRIRQAARREGLLVVAHQGARQRHSAAGGTVCTTRADRPHTNFGTAFTRRELANAFDVCSREMVAELMVAWQVTVIDPDWDSADRLWATMARALGTQRD